MRHQDAHRRNRIRTYTYLINRFLIGLETYLEDEDVIIIELWVDIVSYGGDERWVLN